MKLYVISLILTLLFLSGCKQEKPAIYTIQTHSQQSSKISEHPDLSWSIRTHWKEKELGQFRIGSYELLTINGDLLDLSISKFQGNVGGQLANVNRWRGQVRLEPITEVQLESELATLGHAGIHIVDLISPMPIGGSYQRILGAFTERGDYSYFFKMTGSFQSVDRYKLEFLDLIRSVEFK